jgi:hypothetical protein
MPAERILVNDVLVLALEQLQTDSIGPTKLFDIELTEPFEDFASVVDAAIDGLRAEILPAIIEAAISEPRRVRGILNQPAIPFVFKQLVELLSGGICVLSCEALCGQEHDCQADDSQG